MTRIQWFPAWLEGEQLDWALLQQLRLSHPMAEHVAVDRVTVLRQGGGVAGAVKSAAQTLASLSITIPIEVTVPLPQQYLCLGVGPDLLAGVTAASWCARA